MKPFLLLMATLCCQSVNGMELADAKTPTRQQLIALLSDNTITGSWDGREFTQFFAASGSTLYREGSGPESRGTWRVNAHGQYCSVWPPSPSEACYDVLVIDNNLLWKSGGKIHPSVVSQGDLF